MSSEIRVDLHEHNQERVKQLLEKAKSEDYEVCVWGAGTLGKGFGKQILYDYGIHIDYYCDNNNLLLDTEISNGVYCRSSQKLVSGASKTICFLLMRCDYIMSVYKQLINMRINNIVTYDELVSMKDTMDQYFTFMKKKQIAIYTCITGDYDIPKEPKTVLDNADYFLLSDKKPSTQSIYKWVDINDIIPCCIEDNVMKNRYCKINPHYFFEDYRYSIYFDGNICLKGDITAYIPMLKKTRIGVSALTYIKSVYAEALRCMKIGRDFPEKFLTQVKKYWNQGMPEDFGVFLCNVLIREQNNPICKKIMEDWWEEFSNNSKRDQISFPYVVWKNGYTRDDISLICDDMYMDPWEESPYWDYAHEHKKQRQDVDKGIL